MDDTAPNTTLDHANRMTDAPPPIPPDVLKAMVTAQPTPVVIVQTFVTIARVMLDRGHFTLALAYLEQAADAVRPRTLETKPPKEKAA